MSSAPALRVDVASLIDDRPISALQVRIFVLCALVALLDGVCSQGIGVAAPMMREALDVTTVTFSWAFSAGLFGAAIGAMVFEQPALEQRHAVLYVQRRADTLKGQAELDERDGNGRTHPDDDGVGVEHAGHRGDVGDHPADERIHHLQR